MVQGFSREAERRYRPRQESVLHTARRGHGRGDRRPSGRTRNTLTRQMHRATSQSSLDDVFVEPRRAAITQRTGWTHHVSYQLYNEAPAKGVEGRFEDEQGAAPRTSRRTLTSTVQNRLVTVDGSTFFASDPAGDSRGCRM